MIPHALLSDLLAIDLAPKIRRRLEHYADAPDAVWSVIFEEDRDDVPLGHSFACWVVALRGYPHAENVRYFAIRGFSRYTTNKDRRRVALAVQDVVLRHGGWVPSPAPLHGRRECTPLGRTPPWEAGGWSQVPPTAPPKPT